MAIVNCRTLKKAIRGLKTGEKIYIDALGLSINGINTVREFVEDGILIPDDKGYTPKEDVISGKVLLPHNSYTKA